MKISRELLYHLFLCVFFVWLLAVVLYSGQTEYQKFGFVPLVTKIGIAITAFSLLAIFTALGLVLMKEKVYRALLKHSPCEGVDTSDGLNALVEMPIRVKNGVIIDYGSHIKL